jgi:formylmethanofuran dehydrogenase subunit D
MDKLTLTLITGRSTRQGIGISRGKDQQEYRDATSMIDLNPMDMARSGLGDGDRAQLKTVFGTAVVFCRAADIPEGLAFMAFGPTCSRLIGGETYASGMPDSKLVQVELSRAAEQSLDRNGLWK